MSANNWNKFCLLMWKNWKLQWKHKIQLVFELLLPPLVSLLLVLIRTNIEPRRIDHPTTFAEVPINLELLFENNKIEYDQNAPIKRWEIPYSPKNPCLQKLVQVAVNNLNLRDRDTNEKLPVVGFANSTELQQYLMTNNSLAGIQFEDYLGESRNCPESLTYSLRFPSELRTSYRGNWETNSLYAQILFTSGPRNGYANDGGNPAGYIAEGFIAIQHAIATAFMKHVAGAKKNRNFRMPDVVMQRIAYPPYIVDEFLKDFEPFVAFIFLFSLLYPALQTVKYVTTEKEKRLKEVMKIMGLSNWLHWSAWFVKTFIVLFIPVTITVIFFKIRWDSEIDIAVLTHSDITAVLFFLYVYIIAAITFCFMLATFFSKANTGVVACSFFWALTYFPYASTQSSYSKLSLFLKVMISLLANSGLGFGFKLILQREANLEGLQWSNFFLPINSDDNLSIGILTIIMLVASIIHMLITLYVEKILPGEYGVAEKWYFPFTKSFWCGSNDRQSGYIGDDISNENFSNRDASAYEEYPPNKQVGMSIRGLRKEFGDKVAVNNLSLNLFEDEITALLGHNGAGKTTTISMVIGMFPPTKGTAIINGKDIQKDLVGARMSIGICPQYNVLFDELTVREHIVFFSRLKGLDKSQINNEVQKYVKILQLEPKIDEQSMNLSGGMKRKLSVGAALCGGSKVVLLDEPSSGMDPAARRSLWDLLQVEKKGRTLLLSTHFMDEADVLGDRIAIMCGGELKAYGTTFFLKKKFGVGYHLICVKKDNCNPLHITNLLRRFIPDINIDSDIGTELTYQLPEKFSSHFEEMLGELENKSDDLNLDGYGVSVTTLEEVFMQVGAEQQGSDEKSDEASEKYGDDVELAALDADVDKLSGSYNLLTGISLNLSQWKAMLFKKYLCIIRSLILLIAQNIIPIIFLLAVLAAKRLSDTFKPLSALNVTFNSYDRSVTMLEVANDKPLSLVKKNIAKEYETFIQSYGVNHEVKHIENENLTDFIAEYSKDHLSEVNAKYLVGATFGDNKITAWFNNELLHVAPLSLNAIHNAIARATLGKNHGIQVVNHPLPYTLATQLAALDVTAVIGFLLLTNLTICMIYVSAFYVILPIKERTSKAKLLQFVSGARVLIFWFSQFIADLITFLITALITIIGLACIQVDGFSTFQELGRVFLILIIFALAMLPFNYLFSLLFNEPTTAFSRLSTIYGILVLGLLIIGLITPEISKYVIYLFHLVPHYAFARSLFTISMLGTEASICQQQCKLEFAENQCTPEFLCQMSKSCCPPSYFSMSGDGLGIKILMMLLSCILYFTILFIKEFQLIDELLFRIKLKILPPPTGHLLEDENMDDDVKREKERIESIDLAQLKFHNLVLNKVTKYYSKFLAVKQVSVGIENAECFGLLGVNGAGKTTTFKMMTGDERITFGNAYVKGMNLKNNMNAVYNHIGYCPQFDALLENLTGRETLRIFSLLRGIPERRIKSISEGMARAFGFTKHLDKHAKTYSGGNKRKLSTSIALLGNPSVIYLDEPTTGMDPGSRRQFWNMICKIRDSGKSIILTSHSMEECEALCTRLAIMVNGEFKCIGSTQHLKNKFSKGLVLKIKLKKDDNNNMENGQEQVTVEVFQKKRGTSLKIRRNTSEQSDIIPLQVINENVDRVKRFVKDKFPEAVLQEEYQGILTFYIPLTSIRWSKIFGVMEKNRDQLGVEDYSISQTTLEKIFLEFAKTQHADPKAKP